ncbi:hypothetical protein D0469_06965 [Peribacillus saganii]|uniref:Uncharacterized protein n=1 Tax=Peribacillus saganii TaxID=2303992 RepID=A0A372LS18_9BACI|nr:hypothetical protein [Peribacillus saganii]RFU70334.1 hypothetical protein D0469_06965 [Peribacillus saganii]
MFEDDVILPDDFQADQPQSEEVVDETPVEESFDTNELETTEDEVTPEVEQNTEQPIDQQPQTIKVKFNHEELDLSLDEAIQYAQMGMNYPKLQERLQALESDPSRSFVEEMAAEQGMEVNEFLEAVKEAREQQKLDELIQQNIPEEYAKEMLEARKDRESRQKAEQEKAEQEKMDAEFNDFFQHFKQANDRDYNPDKDQIPQEVWEAHASGVPLGFAYLQYHNNQLKNQLKVLKQNESNTKRAPIGSVTEYGSTEVASEDDFLKGFNSI